MEDKNLMEIYSDLLNKYEQNKKVVLDLKAKKRDTGDQILLDLFEELQIDVKSTLAELRQRIHAENPSFSN